MNNIKEIKSVTFVCENCESIKIPCGNFSKLDFIKVDNEYYDFECVIEKLDNIEYHPFFNNSNPFTRLTTFNDITSVELEYSDGTKKSIQPVWKGTNTINYCQISHMISWNKISISINEENVMKRMRSRCGAKADKILNIIYQDFSIDSCSDCCYKSDCDKLRKNNNDITICDVLELMQK